MQNSDAEPSSSKQHILRHSPFLFILFGAVLLLGVSGAGNARDAQLPYLYTAAPVSSSYSLDQTAAFSGTSVSSLDSVGSDMSIPAAGAPAMVSGNTLAVNTSSREQEEQSSVSSGRRTRETHKYVVQQGDTPSSVAERFGISLNTVLWANDLTNSSVLKSGQELLILPVSGTLHLVREHETLSEIAGWYKADMQKIQEFNELSSPGEIYAGDLLIIPGGTEPRQVPKSRLTPVAQSYFIVPVPSSYRISQGLHPYNAIDFSTGRCGDPVYAAAGGTIQRAGYDAVAGRFARVLHANGVVTFYGHMSRSIVAPGQKVRQGQIIGYIGYSGHTIPAGPGGCHLHFEVRGARNPFQ